MPKVSLNQKFVNDATCPPEKNRVDYYVTTLIGLVPSAVSRHPYTWAGPRRLAEQPPRRFIAATPTGPDRPRTDNSLK